MPRGFLLFFPLLLASAFQTPSDHIAPGTILVASEKLNDPHFVETVVLITRREADGGTMGVILNRPMDLSLAKAFPQMHGGNDPVFDGGPVSADAVQALLRSSEKPETGQHILADIYSIARKAPLEKSIADHLDSSKFRVYLGYAGWGPGQLENEVRLGAWTVVHGSRYVFDSHPTTLWERLNRDTHSQLAFDRLPAQLPVISVANYPSCPQLADIRSSFPLMVGKGELPCVASEDLSAGLCLPPTSLTDRMHDVNAVSRATPIS